MRHFVVYVSGHTEPDPAGEFPPKNCLQFLVVAMDKTYLVELAIDVRFFGTKETKVSQQRSQAETSR